MDPWDEPAATLDEWRRLEALKTAASWVVGDAAEIIKTAKTFEAYLRGDNA